jgi:hypothetical protein
MGVRAYRSQPLRAAQEAKDATLARITAELKALLPHLAHPPRGLFPPRPRYPADARWNADRKRQRRRHWLQVGNPDGSGFTRRPGPYRLPAQCSPDDGHTVVWYGKDISMRFESEDATQATTP